MRSNHRLLCAVCLCVTVLAGAACSAESPTTPTAVPPAARSGGVGFGSGNFVDADSAGEQQNVAVESDSTTTFRGVGFGSGN
jgi:hypothetical protein